MHKTSKCLHNFRKVKYILLEGILQYNAVLIVSPQFSAVEYNTAPGE
jgi:hypothetical protein